MEQSNLVEVKSLLATAITTGSTTAYNILKYHMKLYEFVKAYFAITKQETISYNSYYNLGYSYTLDSSGYVSTFWLKNVDSGFSARSIEMQKAVNKVLEGISSDMTDLEKVVYIHDYLAYNAQYDLSPTVSISSYWPYGVMVKKVGVCDSYSKAFVMLMNKLGIMSEYVLSTTMDHSWNVVKLGDYYYQVDVTWADPITDILGRVTHEFLLRTDDEFKDGLSYDHYDWYNGWSTKKKATDTTYSNWDIHNVKGHMIYGNGDWYYVDSTNSFVKSDILCKNKTIIISGEKERIYALELFNGGWLYTQKNRLMYCDYDGGNICHVVTVHGDNCAIKYLHISESGIVTCRVNCYSDVNDSTTFLSKYDLEYTKINILECINKNISIPEVIVPEVINVIENEIVEEDPIANEIKKPYTIVDYVDGSSINTGYIANSNTSISLDMAIIVANNYGNFINGFNSSSNRLVFRQESTKGLFVAYGWYNSCVYKPALLEKFNVSQLKALTYINGKLVRTSAKQTYQMTNSLSLSASKSRIYGCKIWDVDKLVRDYVPVLDLEGVACLFDLVESKFYYGTSSFGYGK